MFVVCIAVFELFALVTSIIMHLELSVGLHQ